MDAQTIIIATIAALPFIAGIIIWLRNRCKADWSADEILKREG
jgi:hypothetical protein